MVDHETGNRLVPIHTSRLAKKGDWTFAVGERPTSGSQACEAMCPFKSLLKTHFYLSHGIFLCKQFTSI